MQMGQLSKKTRFSGDTICFYKKKGLMPMPQRKMNATVIGITPMELWKNSLSMMK